MIGCLIFGGLAAMTFARAIHHRRMGWGGGGCHGRWHHGWHGGPGGRGFPGGWGRFDEQPVEMGGAPYPEGGFGGGWGGFPGFGGGRMRKRFVVRAVLEHVRATPAQERVIGAAFEEFRDEMKRAVGRRGAAQPPGNRGRPAATHVRRCGAGRAVRPPRHGARNGTKVLRRPGREDPRRAGAGTARPTGRADRARPAVLRRLPRLVS